MIKQVMVEPVLTCDGQTYERAAIAAWFVDHDTSPMTGEPLQTKVPRYSPMIGGMAIARRDAPACATRALHSATRQSFSNALTVPRFIAGADPECAPA